MGYTKVFLDGWVSYPIGYYFLDEPTSSTIFTPPLWRDLVKISTRKLRSNDLETQNNENSK